MAVSAVQGGAHESIVRCWTNSKKIRRSSPHPLWTPPLPSLHLARTLVQGFAATMERIRGVHMQNGCRTQRQAIFKTTWTSSSSSTLSLPTYNEVDIAKRANDQGHLHSYAEAFGHFGKAGSAHCDVSLASHADMTVVPLLLREPPSGDRKSNGMIDLCRSLMRTVFPQLLGSWR